MQRARPWREIEENHAIERMNVDVLGPVHVFGPDGLRVKAMAEIEA